MNAQSLINECLQVGVHIRLDAGTLKLRGTSEAVKSMSIKLRPHKAMLLAYLSDIANSEIAGPFTPYCCPISPELVHELHRLIAQYAALYRLADDATARIIEAAKKQSAASVPNSVAFFKNEIKENL